MAELTGAPDRVDQPTRATLPTTGDGLVDDLAAAVAAVFAGQRCTILPIVPQRERACLAIRGNGWSLTLTRTPRDGLTPLVGEVTGAIVGQDLVRLVVVNQRTQGALIRALNRSTGDQERALVRALGGRPLPVYRGRWQ